MGSNDNTTTRSVNEPIGSPSYARIGDVLAGKYRIERVLGRGGMGVVVAASHVKLRQTVAIKFLLPSLPGKSRLAARLLREARAAAALKGEHVARVFDVDTFEGAPYIVMEYLEGRTLAALLDAEGALSASLAADLVLEACEALAEAHALGIVHRDLKPSNLFLARGPGGRQSLRVLDFGISKALDDDRDGVVAADVSRLADSRRDQHATFSGTDSHALVGSPPYVSPEQLMRPKETDARSDIWSLGVVLYQCLSGRLPFQSETLTGLWDSILRQAAPEFGPAGPSVSPELERVVRRCLEKDPARRYADVRELAGDLVPFASARGWASLDVIEELGRENPRRGPEAFSVRTEEARVDPDGTFTEAPTTRERTPELAMTATQKAWFRSRIGGLIVGGALVAGAVVAFRAGPGGHSSTASVVPAAGIQERPMTPAAVQSTAHRAAPTPGPSIPEVVPSATTPDSRRHVSTPVASSARPNGVERSRAQAEVPPAVSPSPEPASTDVLARAEELLGKGQISEACAVGQVAATTAPDSPRVLEFLGRCHMRLGFVDQARAYYRRYLEVAPNAPNTAFVRAMLEPRTR